ncbi:hypothetical protein [Sphingobacterium anhuiense]|uniref:Uncharacterized protein n=1 Tax=Sphingobacterium anhuiense TaxID=493780 RepID=A0ABW5YPH7_9SPHI
MNYKINTIIVQQSADYMAVIVIMPFDDFIKTDHATLVNDNGKRRVS